MHLWRSVVMNMNSSLFYCRLSPSLQPHAEHFLLARFSGMEFYNKKIVILEEGEEKQFCTLN